MQELLKNAWLGWQSYTEHGKLAALLFAVLLFLWLRQGEKKQKTLLIYTTVMTICCIFPVTAAVLMLYQTSFYDYEWIWSLVPVTLVTAYGITEFLTDKRLYLKESGEKSGRKNDVEKKKGLRFAGIAAMSAAVIFLCGNLGETLRDGKTDTAAGMQSRAVLSVLLEQEPKQDICLWAPQEIVEYARAFDGSIKLLYGRNMWEDSLKGYSYETYDSTTVALYDWMCRLEEAEASQTKPDKTEIGYCIDAAREKGVNRLLLPENISPEMLAQIEETALTQAQKLEGYYLLAL